VIVEGISSEEIYIVKLNIVMPSTITVVTSTQKCQSKMTLEAGSKINILIC